MKRSKANMNRADRAMAAVYHYGKADHKRSEIETESETVISDLVTDIMHLCAAKGINFGDVTARASMHYEEEIEKTCTRCRKNIIHEREGPGDPPEAEYCMTCHDAFCPDCIDWKYIGRRWPSITESICIGCTAREHLYTISRYSKENPNE